MSTQLFGTGSVAKPLRWYSPKRADSPTIRVLLVAEIRNLARKRGAAGRALDLIIVKWL
jgi:hypothetical protein